MSNIAKIGVKRCSATKKWQEISRQEALILKRKQEIELQLKAKQNSAFHCEATDAKNYDLNEDASKAENSTNKFKNDGSFMERFRKLQQEMEAKQEEQVKTENASVASTPFISQTKPKPIMNLSNKRKRNTLIVSDNCEPSVQLSEDDKEDVSKVSSPEEQGIRFAIEKTAIAVAMNGPEAISSIKQSMNNNTDYSWLEDKDSLHYKYFLRRVEALQSAKKRAEDENNSDESKGNSESSSTKRQRKSRWSDAVEPYVPQDVGLIQYAVQVYGKTDISPEQWKQLEDQRKMRLLCDMLQAKQQYDESLNKAGKVKYEYDSDEDTEGGTWEHKRRQAEMANTQKWAELLTEGSKGRHHLGDFLPVDELEKFLFQWENIKDKKASLLHESDYEDFKLQSDNIGYKMLKKLGWKEGEGLGSSSEGPVAPVNKTAAGLGNAGLGQTRPHELREGDDEYDAYRKRMMLAYRFRPNPLNNPRRSYY